MNVVDEIPVSIKKQAMDLEHEELIDILLNHVIGGNRKERMEALLYRLSDKGKRFFLETAMLTLLSSVSKKEGDK